MAAALLDHHAAGRVRVRSAGSTPADEINPAVVAVMADPGGLPAERVRPIRDDIGRSQPAHRSHWEKTRAGTIMVPRTGRGRLRRKPDEIPRVPTPICHNAGYRH